MIPADVYIQYLKKQLESQKTTYDYLQLILPIASGFILAIAGWFFGYIQNKQDTFFQLKKEQYYRSKESMTKIIVLFSEYSTYIYNFVRNVKNIFNSKAILDSQILDDFITESQMKLALIHQMIKIEFPFSNTGVKEINEEVKYFEEMFRQLQNMQSIIINGGQLEEAIVSSDIIEIHRKTSIVMDKVAEIISKVEIEIIKALKEEAVTLKIIKTEKRKN